MRRGFQWCKNQVNRTNIDGVTKIQRIGFILVTNSVGLWDWKTNAEGERHDYLGQQYWVMSRCPGDVSLGSRALMTRTQTTNTKLSTWVAWSVTSEVKSSHFAYVVSCH